MQIKLYINNSEKTKMTKTLTGELILSGQLLDSCSVTDPEILIQGGTAIINKNYMYIPDFGRYYYINDITVEEQGLYRVSAHVDVLMSFNSAILANRAIIDKKHTDGDPYINDGSLITSEKRFERVIPFSGSFIDSGNWVLSVFGNPHYTN